MAEQLYSISELSALTTLDRATVKKYLEGVPHEGGAKNAKTYSLSAALPALVAGRSAEMDEAKLRKTQAEADLKEHALAVERGEFLPVREVENQRVKECQWLFNRLLAQLPREMSQALYKAESPEQIIEILKHDIGRVLNEWRDL
ncbi:MAG TPA: hypothetical protein VGV59_14140 [Pyrinomonadaceae bacterium]|nr:hypothetical protein [Pyrinomonadaceae bacterium]